VISLATSTGAIITAGIAWLKVKRLTDEKL